MTLELLSLIFLLLLSGFFSSSEMAFIVSNKLKIELRARKNILSAKIISYFSENQPAFFSTILISNNIVNISFASLATIFLVEIFNLNDFEILLVSTTLLLLFGEIVPKYIAREHPDIIILISAIPLRVISLVLTPFVKLISKIWRLIENTTSIKEDKINQLFDREDLQTLLSEGSSSGKIPESEYDIVAKVIDLGEQKVNEVFTPRTDIVGLEINASVEDALSVFVNSGYSKLPLYEENLDNIKGFIHSMDMFCKPKTLEEIRRDIPFVPQTKKSLELMNELIDQRQSIAIVVDEFGGTAGVVTIEDIIEEMLGEIRDEHDPDEDVCNKIDDSTFIISAKIEIDYLNEEFGLQIPEGEYETIAGYITSFTGSIPSSRERIEIDKFEFEILRSSKQRIDLVKLYVKEE